MYQFNQMFCVIIQGSDSFHSANIQGVKNQICTMMLFFLLIFSVFVKVYAK